MDMWPALASHVENPEHLLNYGQFHLTSGLSVLAFIGTYTQPVDNHKAMTSE